MIGFGLEDGGEGVGVWGIGGFGPDKGEGSGESG